MWVQKAVQRDKQGVWGLNLLLSELWVLGHRVHPCWASVFPSTCVCAKSLQSCPTPCDPMDCGPPRLLCPWDSPSKNIGVGCHALLQGVLPTQGSNLCLLQFPNCRQILYHRAPGEASHLPMWGIWRFDSALRKFTQANPLGPTLF